MKPDLNTPEAIKFLIDDFYRKVKQNEHIGSFFNEVVTIDWEHHMPKIYQFWEMSLLGDNQYKGNPMSVHQHLNQLSPLKASHFEEWQRLFFESIDTFFSGPIADLAKNRAESIIWIMQRNLN